MKPVVVTHGGVGAPASLSDGCATAGGAALALLRKHQDPLDAAVEAARVLEDDPRFNAGTGSFLRLDGRTVQMDAAVMDDRGRLGAVAAVENLRNPVLVARAVVDTPHTFLCGPGAIAFARRLGHRPWRKVSKKAVERWERVCEAMKKGSAAHDIDAEWLRMDVAKVWNFRRKYEDVLGCDTIGVVVRDARGRFAVAGSTGGSSPMLSGRIGDTPLVGAGFFAGKSGAVAATGRGEEIMRRLLCREVYGWIESGMSPGAACQRGVDLFPHQVQVGLIAVSADDWGVAANRHMAWAACDGDVVLVPEPEPTVP